jgi:chromosome segregation ATPase
MGDTNKVILYSLIGIISSVSLISAIWLGLENRKIYQVYTEEKQNWLKKNRELEYELDKASLKLKELNKKLVQAQNTIQEFEDRRREAEEKIALLSKDNEKLKSEISRLVKERSEIVISPNKSKFTPNKDDSFWSNVLREKANLEFKISNYEHLLEKKNDEISKIETEKEKVDEALKELLEKKVNLEQQLESTRAIVDRVVSDMNQEKEEKLVYAKKLEEVEKEKAILESKIEVLNGDKKNLENKISDLKSQVKQAINEKNEWAKKIAMVNQVLEDKMLEVNKLKSDLELALKNIKKLSYVELPKIEIKNREKTTGKILVSDPLRKFVIINLGKINGISKGAEFLVYKDENVIGKIKVEEVRQATSAAKIIVDLPDKEIAVDDEVKISK